MLYWPVSRSSMCRLCIWKIRFQKAAILYDVASDYSRSTQFFEETFTKLGGEIVMKEGFKTGDVDFRPIAKLKMLTRIWF